MDDLGLYSFLFLFFEFETIQDSEFLFWYPAKGDETHEKP